MKNHLLVFVPGIMGTQLIYSGPGKFKDKETQIVWGEDGSVLWQTLTTAPERLQLPTPLEVGKVLHRIRGVLGGSTDVYGPLLSFLEERLGYEHGNDFVAFGYDWRQSNTHTALSLAEFLRSKIRDGFTSLKLLAHSMGGIVVRLVLGSPEYKDVADCVTSFIQIGTPVRGSSQAYRTLKEGPKFGWIQNFLLGFEWHKHPKQFHRLMNCLSSFPSLFELLPHETDKILLLESDEPCAALDKRAWPHLETAVLQSYVKTHDIVREVRRPYLRSIYSVDIETDSHYIVEPDFQRFKAVIPLPGDGRVLVFSAALGTCPENCCVIRGAVKHDQLPNDGQVWKILETELKADAN